MTKNAVEQKLLKNRNILKKYGVKKLGIFGSYLSGHYKKASDVDLLVEFDETIDLFSFAGLVRELEAVLKKKVDLATAGALKPYLKDKILGEVEWFAGH